MNLNAEWLEADGCGGFASGTVGGARTRRYHALLLPATRPPVGRLVLVNDVEAYLQTPGGRFPLSTQRYLGGDSDAGVLAPRGQVFLVDFRLDPWPRWTFQFPDGTRLEHEKFVHQGMGLTALTWKLLNPPGASAAYRLELRPFFSGRDYHALHRENDAFAFEPVAREPGGSGVRWQPYAGLPGVRVWSSLTYRHEPAWYRNFLYPAERERGLEGVEDLAVPGVFLGDLGHDGTAALLLGAVEGAPAGRLANAPLPPGVNAAKLVPALRDDELRRRRALSDDPLRRAGDAYVVRGDRGTTIMAGYPWFTDWGRDTFISLRGLCLAAGRFEEAREILLGWAGAVSGGMLPNRFPDGGGPPEYHTVDAALWFVVAAHDYLALAPARTEGASLERWARDQTTLLGTCEAILAGYAAGTRFGIRLDELDGLLFAGEPGGTTALTWMDARVDERPVTPRVGKPVEVQALWLNALGLLAANSPRWRMLYEKGRIAFAAKFWHEERGCLYDVIDHDGQPGARDGSLRPNQIFAVGGLPLVLLPQAQARRMVAVVEKLLLTPSGLRTLAPGDAGYRARYEGGPAQRDAAYHQGTAWPWLLGPFVEAVVRVNGDTREARDEAREKYLDPLLARLPSGAGLNHLPEITDAAPPYTPRGCPFQAWSMGELTRLALSVLK